MRNNEMEAIILPYKDYEIMKDIIEKKEYESLYQTINERNKTPENEYVDFDEIIEQIIFNIIYKIKLHPLAEKEFHKLDSSIKKLVVKQINKLKNNPEYGEDLGNKHGFDLTGYKKIYAVKKNIRIIYKIEKEKILIKIIAIGKRDDFEVYQDADKRKD